MTPPKTPAKPQKPANSSHSGKKDRLANALRANLLRRKASHAGKK